MKVLRLSSSLSKAIVEQAYFHLHFHLFFNEVSFPSIVTFKVSVAKGRQGPLRSCVSLLLDFSERVVSKILKRACPEASAVSMKWNVLGYEATRMR